MCLSCWLDRKLASCQRGKTNVLIAKHAPTRGFVLVYTLRKVSYINWSVKTWTVVGTRSHLGHCLCFMTESMFYNYIQLFSLYCQVCILFLSLCFVSVACSPQSVFYTDHVNQHKQTSISMRDGMPLLPKPGQLFCLGAAQTLNCLGFIYRTFSLPK